MERSVLQAGKIVQVEVQLASNVPGTDIFSPPCSCPSVFEFRFPGRFRYETYRRDGAVRSCTLIAGQHRVRIGAYCRGHFTLSGHVSSRKVHFKDACLELHANSLLWNIPLLDSITVTESLLWLNFSVLEEERGSRYLSYSLVIKDEQSVRWEEGTRAGSFSSTRTWLQADWRDTRARKYQQRLRGVASKRSGSGGWFCGGSRGGVRSDTRVLGADPPVDDGRPGWTRRSCPKMDIRQGGRLSLIRTTRARPFTLNVERWWKRHGGSTLFFFPSSLNNRRSRQRFRSVRDEESDLREKGHDRTVYFNVVVTERRVTALVLGYGSLATHLLWNGNKRYETNVEVTWRCA